MIAALLLSAALWLLLLAAFAGSWLLLGLAVIVMAAGICALSPVDEDDLWEADETGRRIR